MTTRKALSGRCLTCQAQTVRGEDQDGEIAVIELRELDAAGELREWVAGVTTYRLTWKGHMRLDRRTDDDLRTDPAGFREGRIHPQHRHTTEGDQP